MSKKSGGKKGRHRSKKAIDTRIEKMLEGMAAYRLTGKSPKHPKK